MQNYTSEETFIRKRPNITLLLLISAIACVCCSDHRPVNSNKVRQEMESREAKKVTAAEIMVAGERLGIQVLDTVEQVFKTELLNAMSKQGVAGAINYCNLNAQYLATELQDSLEITIRRVTDRPRNPLDTLTSMEQTIFEAYQFSPELATTQLQELDEKTLILTKPIRISSGTCLSCHGKATTDIQDDDLRLIKSLYPEDSATGYASGDLRGMWSLIIPKKTIVKRL